MLAGSDKLPLLFARGAQAQGEEIIAIAVRGFTSRDITSLVKSVHWIEPGELSEALRLLDREGITRVVMVGKIPQAILFSPIQFDQKTNQLLRDLKDKQTGSLLGGVALELERRGIELVDARPYLGDALAAPGILGKRKPSEEEKRDIEYGRGIAAELGRLDIGQTVIVKKGAVLAVEAIEGTDAAIRRAASLGKEGIVVVKIAKPNQDLRFDLPVIGRDTLELLREVKGGVLAVEAGKTVILDRPEAIAIADDAGVALVGI